MTKSEALSVAIADLEATIRHVTTLAEKGEPRLKVYMLRDMAVKRAAVQQLRQMVCEQIQTETNAVHLSRVQTFGKIIKLF